MQQISLWKQQQQQMNLMQQQQMNFMQQQQQMNFRQNKQKKQTMSIDLNTIGSNDNDNDIPQTMPQFTTSHSFPSLSHRAQSHQSISHSSISNPPISNPPMSHPIPLSPETPLAFQPGGPLTPDQKKAICKKYNIPLPQFCTPLEHQITINNVHLYTERETTVYSPTKAAKTARRS